MRDYLYPLEYPKARIENRYDTKSINRDGETASPANGRDRD